MTPNASISTGNDLDMSTSHGSKVIEPGGRFTNQATQAKAVPTSAPAPDIRRTAQRTTYTNEANALITLLEQHKRDYQLLSDAIAQHRQQSDQEASRELDGWATLARQTAASEPSQYSGIFRPTIGTIKTLTTSMLSDIDSGYDLASAYVLSDRETASRQSAEGAIEKCLAMTEQEWSASVDFQCSTQYVEGIAAGLQGDSQQLAAGAEKLSIADSEALKAISANSQLAQSEINDDVNMVSGYMQTAADTKASFDTINSQLQQDQALLKAENTPIVCHTTSDNGSIFSANLTTTCAPSTETPAQICADKMAAWLASGR